jgi:hypothetical protein
VTIIIIVGFEVLTAVAMYIATFWDIGPCSPYVSRRFGGIYRLHLQGGNVSRARNQRVGRLGRILPAPCYIPENSNNHRHRRRHLVRLEVEELGVVAML